MIREVFMPALSSTMTEGKIVSWAKSPGDKVEKGDTVVIVESDKADMDVESFYEGTLATVIVDAGEMAQVNQVIAFLAESPEEIEEAKQKASALANGDGGTNSGAAPISTKPEPAPAATSQTVATGAAQGNPSGSAAPTTEGGQNGASTAQSGSGQDGASSGSGRVIVSPRARKLAKTLKVNLEGLQGSGPHGRIVAEDIEKAAGKAPVADSKADSSSTTVSQSAATAAVAGASTASVPQVVPAAPTPAAASGELVAFNAMQNAVVRNMEASLTIPVFRVGYTITVDELNKLYKQIKPKGVTMTALLAKAVAVTLKKHPVVNASYSPSGIQYSSSINIAVAVATPDGGLITPVLRGADQMDIYSLARSWKDLVARSRSKKLAPDEYSTGTFTLSNLGMFGVDSFDAVLTPGQGSILAVGGSRPEVVATPDGMMGVKNQMNVKITCDHRIIYGADGAAFLKDLCDLIENNAQSLTL